MTASAVTSSSSVSTRTPDASCSIILAGQRSLSAVPSRSAKRVASCWLPPATPPARPGLETGGHIGERGGRQNVGGYSVRRGDAGYVGVEGGTRERPQRGLAQQVGQRGGCPGRRRRGSDGLGASSHVGRCRRGTPARFSRIVRHRGACKLKTELGELGAHHVVAVEHELGAALYDGAFIARKQLLRPHPAANPVSRLKHNRPLTGSR